MSQYHDDKKTKRSPMDTANPRPRARRPDMQLYVPRAMRRDSLESSNLPLDKAVCIENPNETFALQRNVEATNNKKHQAKKSTNSNQSPDNNNIGDNSQRKRAQRTSPKNNAIQSASPQLVDPVGRELEVIQIKKDDKVKKNMKKTKRNIKPTLSANSPTNGDISLAHEGSGDHEHVPASQENANGPNSTNDAHCSDNRSLLLSTEDNAKCETSQRLPTAQPSPTTIPQENFLSAEHLAVAHDPSAPDNEHEILPNETYSNGCHTALSQEVTHELEVAIPVTTATNNLDSSCLTKKMTTEFVDDCSKSIKCTTAEGNLDTVLLSAESECDGRHDMKLEDQVKMLSRCDVTELAKLGCESIEMFLKETAVLISELDSTNSETSLEPVKLSSPQEIDTASVGRPLEPKPIVICLPDKADDSEVNVFLPPKGNIFSCCDESNTSETLLTDDVSFCQEEIYAYQNESAEANTSLHKVTLSSVNSNSSLVENKVIEAVLGWDLLQDESATVCNEAFGTSNKGSYKARSSEETDTATTSCSLSTENLFTSTCSTYVLSPVKSDSASIKINHASDLLTCEHLLRSDKININCVALDSDPAKVDLCSVRETEDVDTGQSKCVPSSIPSKSTLTSEVDLTFHKSVETDTKPSKELPYQSNSYQSRDTNILQMPPSVLRETEAVPCVPVVEPGGCNVLKAQDSQLEKGTASSEKMASRDADLSDVSRQSIPTSNDSSFTSVDVSLENGDDSWEAMYDEAGECLNPDLMKELTITVGKKIKVQRPKIDYTKFQPKEPQISDNEFGHVIEIYDFPVEFKTQDLMAGFAQFQNRGFDIKWVDDTHALGLFASPMAAADALNSFNPMFKTRPLSQATRESKVKAKRCAEFLQPYRPRPETSASLARRLVSGALGLQVRIPKEQRELERQKLREAKEKRKLAAKQKVDVWEGVVASPP